MGAASLHKFMGAASLHKSMGAASLNRSMGPAPCTSQWELHPYTFQWVLHPCISQWELHPCTGQWELHTCTGQWVLHPCTGQWVLHPCTSQWELQPHTSQWVLCPCTSQWELHPCTSQWVLHPGTSQWVLHPVQVNGCCIPVDIYVHLKQKDAAQGWYKAMDPASLLVPQHKLMYIQVMLACKHLSIGCYIPQILSILPLSYQCVRHLVRSGPHEGRLDHSGYVMFLLHKSQTQHDRVTSRSVHAECRSISAGIRPGTMYTRMNSYTVRSL